MIEKRGSQSIIDKKNEFNELTVGQTEQSSTGLNDGSAAVKKQSGLKQRHFEIRLSKVKCKVKDVWKMKACEGADTGREVRCQDLSLKILNQIAKKEDTLTTESTSHSHGTRSAATKTEEGELDQTKTVEPLSVEQMRSKFKIYFSRTYTQAGRQTDL